MATSADQINTTHLTQLMILNLGSRNACMRALIAHPTDLNAAANWLINHRNDANIDTDPFAAQTTTTTATTTTTTTTTTSNTNTTNTYSNRYQTTTNINTNTNTNTTQQHTQQHMIQQVMNLGYTRDEALRAYTNVTTSDRNETNKLVDYLVKNPKKENKKSTYNTYSSNSSYYPYSSSNKKKVYRPVINIDDIKVEKEEICDIEDCECLEHIGIILREYKKFLNKNCVAANNENNNENKNENYEKNGFYAYFLEKISGDGEYTLSDVMDDFIHLIKKHDIRYGEYSKIYKYIISKDSLNGILSTDKYNLLQRIILCNSLSDLEINKLYFGFKSIKEITIQQLCDKMYCYLVLTYTIGGQLEYDKYLLLDNKYDIPPMKQHKETGKIKEKSISQYIGTKQYINYLQLLYNNKQNEIIINKFHCAFNVEQLEIRIDPKELKSKLAREKREKKRKLLEEKKRLKALEDNKKEEKEDNKEDNKKEEESVALPSVLPSKIIDEKDNNKKEDNNNKKEDNNNKKEFSFGVRYNYWPKDNEDLIGITIREDDAKYLTLKDELIGNGLSIFNYNILLEKANIYFNTEYCQDTIEAGVNPFGIKLLDKITIKHIISLMIYCNYNKIRNKFILTFIRQNNGKEDNISMIKRHSNFYHLGKLVRESIECYGEEAHRSETKVFYHSINMNKKIMSDSEIKSLFIYTPFSTTSCMEICLNNKPQLIMELKGYVSKYFDCSWISDLCFEKEQIFCGGTRALTINKCIDGKYGYDHKLFINSIKYIPNIFKTNVSEWKINKNDDMLQETKEMIRNLLYYQLNKSQNKLHNKYPNNLSKLGIPLDIEQSLNQFCISTNSIRMHYDAMYNHRAYGFLSSLFMTPTRTFTKLNVITQLFPKINTFSMISTPLTTLTFLYIKSYISPNNNNNNNNEEEKDDYKNNQQQPPPQITEIRLIDPKTAAMSIEQVIQAEKKSLAQLQWIIQSNDQVSLVLKYSDKPVIIKEPTPPPQPIIEEKKEEKKQDEKQKRVRKKIRRKKVVKKLKQGENQKKSKLTNEPGAVVVSSTDNKGTDNKGTDNKGTDKGN